MLQIAITCFVLAASTSGNPSVQPTDTQDHLLARSLLGTVPFESEEPATVSLLGTQPFDEPATALLGLVAFDDQPVAAAVSVAAIDCSASAIPALADASAQFRSGDRLLP